MFIKCCGNCKNECPHKQPHDSKIGDGCMRVFCADDNDEPVRCISVLNDEQINELDRIFE